MKVATGRNLDSTQYSHHLHHPNEDFVAELFEAPAQFGSTLFCLIQVVVHMPSSTNNAGLSIPPRNLSRNIIYRTLKKMAAVSNAQNNKMHIVFFWEYTRLKPTFFRSLLLRAASRF
jgi:hypothetical protein